MQWRATIGWLVFFVSVGGGIVLSRVGLMLTSGGGLREPILQPGLQAGPQEPGIEGEGAPDHAEISADLVGQQGARLSFSGRVERRSAGSNVWQSAKPDEPPGAGETLRTGPDGKAQLRLPSGLTIELLPNSELTITALSDESALPSPQAVVGLLRGTLNATVPPLAPEATSQVDTAAVTARVPEGTAGSTFLLGVNPDGSVTAKSESGLLELIREGEPTLSVRLDSGDEALVAYEPATGALRVTCVAGTLEVIGPDKLRVVLARDETVVYRRGAATFIPATPPVTDVPALETIFEPLSGS